MKKYILFVICALLVIAVMAIPEVQTHFCTIDGTDTLTAIAVGPVFAPLKWPTGRNNMGGYKGMLLFIPYNAPTAVPMLPTDIKSNEDLVKATGTFTFPADGPITKPIYLYSTDATVEYKAEAQGETDGISYKQTATFFFPGNMPEVHAFNALVKNTPGYLILEDSDGQQIMMGRPGMYPSISPAFNGGKARADRRGTTYTATCDANETAVFLATPIDMEVIGGLKPEGSGDIADPTA